ncbi:hypothetical protein DAMA08_001180 [Martiniozyma asiatica (nom. inval.)]|nr:hypothetical protein DAMA08_001180 [Martiniozyma asiatica]
MKNIVKSLKEKYYSLHKKFEKKETEAEPAAETETATEPAAAATGEAQTTLEEVQGYGSKAEDSTPMAGLGATPAEDAAKVKSKKKGKPIVEPFADTGV